MSTTGFDTSSFVTVLDAQEEYVRLIRQTDNEGLYFDTVIGLAIEPGGKVSEHPGESARAVSDAFIEKSTRVVIQGVVANTSLEDFPDQTPDRISAAISWFQESTAVPLTVGGPRFEPFFDMVVESWKYQYTLTDAVTFTVALKNVRVAQALVGSVLAPVTERQTSNPGTSNGMEAPANDGSQPPEEATTETVRNRSYLHQLLGN